MATKMAQSHRLISLTSNLCFISNDGVDMFLKHDSSTTLVGYE